MTFPPGTIEAHAQTLRLAEVPSPDVDARLLAEHVAEHGGDAATLAGLVARRAAREPLQLIVGEAWFRWVRLACRPGVFIPRPETEIIAGVAIEAALAAGRVSGRPVRVAEPCTGTGAITCALVTEVPGVDVIAVDQSPDAVDLARWNVTEALAGRAGHAAADGARAEVRAGDLLDALDPDWRGTIDVLVVNPPYLPAADRGSWDAEVGAHDPDEALVGGPDGHELVDRVLVEAGSFLAPGGLVVVEIDDRRGDAALRAALAAGLVEARIVVDLAGRDRGVAARRPGTAAARLGPLGA